MTAEANNSVPDPAEVEALAADFGRGRFADFEPLPGPRHWPKLPAEDARRHWSELKAWVDELLERFEHLDHHTIPFCWWRHNGHVEALAALRDHERQAYMGNSPPSAAIEWHRALRDTEVALREWTSTLACGAQHSPRSRPPRPTDEDRWKAFVDDDVARRAKPATGTGQ